MIVLEQQIAISIYHCQTLQRFDITEVLTDDGILSFKVMKQRAYYFTLIGEGENNVFKLRLSRLDKEPGVDIDSEVFSKIKVSLYCIFINGKAS